MWIRSMLRDNAKALIPFADQLRALKRRHVPYTDNPNNTNLVLEQGLSQVAMLARAGARLDGDVLEIGTGWMPIVPLLFHAAGARHVTCTDVERLLDDATLQRARARLGGETARIAQELGLPEPTVAARLSGPWPHDYLVPWDIDAHPEASADIVVLRAVFEHIDPPTLRRYLMRLQAILRPGGMMCHVIDNSDHWEHRDKSISRLNFLRYEDGPFWRFTALNRQKYQNRLCHGDYAALFRETGWTVLEASGTPDPASLRALSSLPLASPFCGRSAEDLAILTSWFVVQRPA